MKHIIFWVALISVFSAGCTNNPFFGDDDTAKDKHFAAGTVVLSDGSSPLDTYVWAQDLNISSRCNSKGEFSLQIPRTPEYEGLNGSFTIYFYMGNYHYQTASVVVRNGQFEYGQQNITADGRFDRTIVLSKMLEINTTIRPDTISAGASFEFTIILELVNIDSFVSIITEADRDGFLRGYFIRSLDLNTPAKLLFPQGTKPAGYKIDTLTIRETTSRFSPDSITAGDYEIIPYIRVVQSGLPEELLLSLGAKVNQYDPEYLNVPYIRTHARFVIEKN
jgi:hypothetical protein